MFKKILFFLLINFTFTLTFASVHTLGTSRRPKTKMASCHTLGNAQMRYRVVGGKCANALSFRGGQFLGSLPRAHLQREERRLDLRRGHGGQADDPGAAAMRDR